MQDFEDQIIEQSQAFNSKLDGYHGYERKPFYPNTKQPIELMIIDIATRNLRKDIEVEDVEIDGNMSYRTIEAEFPLLQIYCVTMAGQPVIVNISDFVPYMMVQMPEGFEPSKQNLDKLKSGLNSQLKKCSIGVTKITEVTKMSIRNFKPKEDLGKEKFLKIETLNPRIIPELRKMFEERRVIRGVELSYQTFESNIPYLLRFMIDKDIVGTGWVRISKFANLHLHKKSSYENQAEISCSVHDVEAIPCEGTYAQIAPLRVLSFDIECAAEKGFPSAERDPIIQIACVCKTTSKEVEDYKVVFVLNGASPISGVHVKHMDNERDLLLDFQKLIIAYDPDFITGYNMINFDFKYILERAKFLKIHPYGYFGRNKCMASEIRIGKFQSKAMGMRDTVEINTVGRIQLDLLTHMHREFKLTSYRLNNVSYEFLGTQKEDVHHSQIAKLHHGNKIDRKRLAVYCLKDAQLPLMLMEKLCFLYNYCQMARVTGVPINFLLQRGQQIKVVSQLLRKAKQYDYIMPTEKVRANDPGIGFEGAYVLDPIPGFYEQPIATLDFASLYPSIMRAHNLCYTTLVNPTDIAKYGLQKDIDYIETSEKQCFVKKSLKEGLLPEILKQLITARKKAKRQLAEATDPMLRKVLDGRQLALKISANSVYGFTGATVGQLPCLAISSSVTLIGRQMIEKTKNLVTEKYNAQVIYGDTDSVMVKFQLSQGLDKQGQIRESMDLGKSAAQQISQYFQEPIKLEFQKVYCPYLLVAKKRYAGVYYTQPTKWDKIDKKGIETVRRDNCLLIRQMLETVLDTILCRNDRQQTSQYIKKTISNLLQNKIDISKLVITKAISKGVEEDTEKNDRKEKDKKKTYKSKQAHTELAEKMRKRDENVDIHIGDRIAYVIIEGAKGSKNYENAEDPIKVLNEDLPIDYDYYIQKQIKPPLERLLKNTNILKNFQALFIGDHTKIRYTPKLAANSALGTFFKKASTCTNCRQTVPQTTALCKNCEDTPVQIFEKKTEQYMQLQRQYLSMLIQCNNCQGSNTNDVICSNFDCPIFYRRYKVHKEKKEKEKQLEKFDW